MEIQLFEKGEFLCRQGGAIQSIFLLLEGKLQVDGLHPDGRVVIFSFEKPFSIIGEVEYFNNKTFVANVLAVEDSLVFAIPVDFAREVGLNDPNFLKLFIRNMTNKLYFDVPHMMQVSMTAEKRIIRYLMVEFENQGEEIRFEKRESIAALLGMSVRHLNRTLLKMEQDGYIKKKYKTVQILSMEKMKEALVKGT